MQNNPNGPYDEVFSNLAKVVEDIIKNMPDSQHARIIGYTIITRSTSGEDPGIMPAGMTGDDDGIPYEVVETGEEIFITATLPAGFCNAPVAEIEPDQVRIQVDDRTTTILLPHPIDRIHSTYRVHRGVMDISLRKAVTPLIL